MADILTRRAARLKSAENRGYTRGNFQLAMINAKNALRRNSDLRGKELRQTARRMVAGVGEYAQSNLPGTFEEFINQPKYIGAPDQGGAAIAKRAVQRGSNKGLRISPIEASTPQIGGGLMGTPPVYTPTADLTQVGSFDNAFALARKNGMKVFTWNGKKYGTKTDPNWRERWGRNKPKDAVSTTGGGESSSKPASGNLNLTGKTDNWNISDILSEDFYNDLQNSIQAGIDEEIANQENAGIQNIIDHRYDDLGPTMNRPDYMIYMPAPTNGSKPGWYASGVTTWRRGFRDGVYGDITSKDGKDYFNPLPEEYQKYI